MTKSLVLHAVGVLMLGGCATIPTKGKIESKYIDQIEPGMKSKDVELRLTRANALFMGNAWVKVYPYTKVLLELQSREDIALGSKTQKEADRDLKVQMAALVVGKTCFAIQMGTQASIESSQFKNWVLKLNAPGLAEPLSLEFDKATLELIPKYELGPGPATWKNIGVGCVRKTLSLGEGFSIDAFPQVYKEKLTLLWM